MGEVQAIIPYGDYYIPLWTKHEGPYTLDRPEGLIIILSPGGKPVLCVDLATAELLAQMLREAVNDE